MAWIEESWSQVEPDIEREWEGKHPGPDPEWKDVRHAYRFGWQAALRPEFQHHSWEEAKEDLSQHWYEPVGSDEEDDWPAVRRLVEAGWRLARRYCYPALEAGREDRSAV